MRYIFLIIGILLVAFCAGAQSVTPGHAVEQSFKAGTTKDGNIVDGVQCGRIQVVITQDITGNSDTTFAGTIDQKTEGAWATALTIAQGTFTLPAGRQLFRVNPSAAPASGSEASVVFKCQEQFSVNPSVPGLIGGFGDDRTYTYIDQNLEQFGCIDDSKFERHFYYSSFNGNDSNYGTRDSPWQTINKLLDEGSLAYTRNTLITTDGSVWSPYVITSATNFSNAFSIGDTVTWDNVGDGCPGTEVGSVVGLDDDHLAIRLDSTAETAPATGDELCSEDDATELSTITVTDTINIGDTSEQVTPDLSTCAEDDPCILIESDDPPNKAIIDASYKDYENSAAGPTLFYPTGSNTNDEGIFAVQNISCQYFGGDCFGTQDGSDVGGRIIALNTKGRSFNIGTGTDSNNNGFTTHDRGWVTVLGARSSAYSETTSTSGAGAAVAPANVDGGGVVWIGSGTITAEPLTAGALVSPFRSQGGDTFVMGPRFSIYGNTNTAGVYGISMLSYAISDTAAKNYAVTFAKISSIADYRSNVAGFGFDNDSSSETGTTNLRFYESTLTGRRGMIFGDFVNRNVALLGRGLVIDDITNITFGDFSAMCNAGQLTIDLQGVIDADDDSTLCFDDVAGADTVALCEASGLIGDCSGSFFSTNSDDSDGASAGTDGVWWSQDSYGDETVTVDFVDSDPDTITRATGDFTTQFGTGPTLIRTTSSADAQNDRIWKVDSIAALTITLAADETVVAAVSDSVELRQYDLPQLAPHPESDGYGTSIGTYTITIPNEEAYLPKWVTPACEEIRGFTIYNGTNGG